MSIESLYPFLYEDKSDLNAILEQVRASTVAKIAEIAELRATIAKQDGARLEACASEAAQRFRNGGRLLAFGNGGSATDAQQLATLFLSNGLPAFALGNDTAIVTALCNDIGVEVVFSRQLAAFGRKDDIAVGLSTSGNSANLLRAFDEASRRGMLTIGMAGYDGGKLAELASADKHCIDYLFVQPSTSIHRIQEAQTTTYQVFWELTQEEPVQEGAVHVPRHTG
jgi:D-sedoheptulose 7-phosphate isomerase